MSLVFEWDEEKSKQNTGKHGVSFEEAKTVFNDPCSITTIDLDHSVDEERWLDIGLSTAGRIIVVWYTERGERIRLIGCRNATKLEVKAYTHE